MAGKEGVLEEKKTITNGWEQPLHARDYIPCTAGLSLIYLRIIPVMDEPNLLLDFILSSRKGRPTEIFGVPRIHRIGQAQFSYMVPTFASTLREKSGSSTADLKTLNTANAKLLTREAAAAGKLIGLTD